MLNVKTIFPPLDIILLHVDDNQSPICVLLTDQILPSRNYFPNHRLVHMSLSSDGVTGSLRKSSRKRRSPGEWWRDFDTGKRRVVVPTSSTNSAPRRKLLRNDSCLSNARENDSKGAMVTEGDQRNETIAIDETLSVPSRTLITKLGLPSGELTVRVKKNGSDATPVPDNSSARQDLTAEHSVKRGGEKSVNDGASEENTTELHAEEEALQRKIFNPATFSPSKTRQDLNISFAPSVPVSRRTICAGQGTEILSQPGKENSTSAESSRLEFGSALHSRRTNSEGNTQRLVSKPCGKYPLDARFDFVRDNTDHRKKNEKRKERMGRARGTSKGDFTDSPQLPEGDADLRQHDAQNLFGRGRKYDASDEVFSRSRDESPIASRRLSINANVDDVDLSLVNAPRKKKLQTFSPSYSFSLRSRFEPELFSEPVKEAEGFPTAPLEKPTKLSACVRQEVLMAKRTSLQHHLVKSPSGAVKVAISMSLNQSTVGEIVILPRSATGPRRALSGDEFYIVKQGHAECNVGFTSLALSGGDHLGIPEGQCFEILNPYSSRCELYFFSPKNSKQYSLAH